MSYTTTKCWRFSLFLLLLLGFSPQNAIGEDLPSNASIQAGLEALGWGFSPEERYLSSVRFKEEMLSTTVEVWEAAYPTEADTLQVRIEFIEHHEDLIEVWEGIARDNDPGNLVVDGPLGDISILGKGSLKFMRGNLAVSIGLNRIGPSNETLRWPDDQETLTEIGIAIVQALEASGADKLPQFTANFTPLSLEPPLRILIEPSETGEYDLFYSLRDLSVDPGKFVFQSGPISFTDTKNLLDNTTLPPGSYLLSVSVRDGFGRRIKTEYNIEIASDEDHPTSQTLPTTKDTTLLTRNPHQNEGANPRLHLKKVTGKPAQVLVGFDTANIDTNGLTRASLVLNIDSTQDVTGWGNGRPIRAQRLLTAWTEGNGKSLDLPNNQRTSGSGPGATWFSPIDSNINNSFADSTVNWNGGATYAAPATAPTVSIKNHQSGEVVFDVTQDLLQGAEHGWLITRDQDVGSQVTFLSKEGGSSDLAPKLVLEYGSTVAQHDSKGGGFLATLGLRKALQLSKNPSGSELKTPREILQDSPVAAMIAEQALTEITRGNPALSIASRAAYRSWLEREPRIANVGVSGWSA